MHGFGYYDPTSVSKAVAILDDKPEARYLAGGQSLVATMKLGLSAPSDLVDLRQIPDLRGIRLERDGSVVTVGAMVRHAEVAESRDVADRIPALADLAGMIGDRQVRNRGTIGGSLANNDPAADYPAAVLGLGATINTNKRRIAADDWFHDLYETALGAGELITSVAFPVAEKAAYLKFRNAASRFAIVGVFVAKTRQGARVAVTGASPQGAFRVRAMEEALTREWSAAALRPIDVPAAGLQADLHASADYRAHLISVLAQRAVAATL
ncbi:MAG TPA: xanthine dehydrogenase family protein subunit M [Usitatibacter sp.]|jgi:carbon-monoxide dehydrogenase medium subunit|nr:xanthine dehydrogenase family protein subunit M [Usitatibacter sp.]